MEIFKFFVSDAEFHAAKRIGLDKIDEFPTDGTLRELGLQLANQAERSNPLEKTANGAGNTDIDLGDTELDMFIGAKLGEIDVIDTNDFAAGRVDDLLVEKIFLYGQPGFVGLISGQSTLVDIEIDAAGSNFGDLVIAGDEGLVATAGDEEVGNAIGLIGRLDEKFADTADVVGLSVEGGGAHEFGGVEHEAG